jgi:hypothetical protein
MKTNLLKKIDGKIVYDGIKMEAFIPDDFFKKKLADSVGSSYYLFGSFLTLHYPNKSTERKDALRASFEFPAKFYTRPNSVEVEKLDLGYGETKYHVMTYYNGDVVFESSEVIKSVDNVKFFMSLLTGGKLDIMDYEEIPTMMQLCKIYNGMSFNAPAMYEEVIIADYYRDPADPKRPARFVAKSHGSRVFGVNQREKASFTSTFSALTFEDPTYMMTVADNYQREGHKEIVSDVEKVSLDLI